MLKFKKGCTVPFPEKLREEFEVCENLIIANVGTDKFKKLLLDFICIHNEPEFFILEIPANLQNDDPQNGAFYKDVYYIDGCSNEEAQAILDRVGELLFNDGVVQFGFGCHESQDEIMIEKYNVVVVYSKQINNYISFFEKNGICRTETIITAWDTFSRENYGTSRACEVNGERIYDIPKIFSDWGIYLAEQREDN